MSSTRSILPLLHRSSSHNCIRNMNMIEILFTLALQYVVYQNAFADQWKREHLSLNPPTAGMSDSRKNMQKKTC